MIKEIQTCDKCGKELGKRSVTLYIKENYKSILKIGLPKLPTVAVHTKSNRIDYFEGRIDLCEECTEKFYDWLAENNPERPLKKKKLKNQSLDASDEAGTDLFSKTLEQALEETFQKSFGMSIQEVKRVANLKHQGRLLELPEGCEVDESEEDCKALDIDDIEAKMQDMYEEKGGEVNEADSF